MSRPDQNRTVALGIELFRSATENGLPDLLKATPDLADLRKALSTLGQSLVQAGLVKRLIDGWHGYGEKVAGLRGGVVVQLARETEAALRLSSAESSARHLSAAGQMTFLNAVRRLEKGRLDPISPNTPQNEARHPNANGKSHTATLESAQQVLEYRTVLGNRVIYTPGANVATAKADILINTVNCRLSPSGREVLGKGVAKAFADEYPEVRAPYKAAILSGELRPGRCLLFPLKTGGTWAALATKDHWQNPSKISWVRDGLRELAIKAEAMGAKSIALPPPGCGNGKLDWAEVGPIVPSTLCKFDLQITAASTMRHVAQVQPEDQPSRFLL